MMMASTASVVFVYPSLSSTSLFAAHMGKEAPSISWNVLKAGGGTLAKRNMYSQCLSWSDLLPACKRMNLLQEQEICCDPAAP